jgi:molecular chaperone GrpE
VDEDAKPEPQVRVVDRRWWARAESDGAAPAGGTKPTYVEELEQQLADRSAKLQSAVAEFEQVKARLRRDTIKAVERERRAMLVELLDVLDNLERALTNAGEHEAAAPLARGVALVRDQFVAKLESFGVRRQNALHQPFDAAVHEAVSTAEVADPAQDGVVVAVVKNGYAIGDELLRPASVVVGQRPAGAHNG